MEYECQLVVANRVLTDFNKVIRPLCSSCTNTACSNPVYNKKISVFGQIYSGRVYTSGSLDFFVTACDGYRGNFEDEEEDDFEEDFE